MQGCDACATLIAETQLGASITKRRGATDARFAYFFTSSSLVRRLFFLFWFWYGAGHHVLQRILMLLLQLGMRQRLPRQHLVTRGSVVDEDRFNHGRLRQIVRLQAFVGILVGVVRARGVVELILDELEARNTD